MDQSRAPFALSEVAEGEGETAENAKIAKKEMLSRSCFAMLF
jgi:hypothetical protein